MQSYTQRYALFGIAFGCCFPIIAIFFDLEIHLEQAFTWENIKALHRNNPIHFIIDSAPLFLGLAFGIAGSKQESVTKLNSTLLEKNAALNKAMADIKAAQERSLQNEKMAAFGLMAERLSHELQNPLNFINNFSDLSVELIEEFKATESEEIKVNAAEMIEENFKKIFYHGQRAEQIIRKLQDFAKTGNAHTYFES